MTLRGAIRSYNAAVRRAEREAARMERERIRRYKAELKQQALDDAESDVEDYNELVKALQGFHKESFRPIEWAEIVRESEPSAPRNDSEHERQAQKNLEIFKPSFFQKLFRLDRRMRASLEQKLTAAIQRDSFEYAEALKIYKERVDDWRATQALAKKVLEGDRQSYLDALNQTNPFDELKDFGASVIIDYLGRDAVLANVKFRGDSVVPTESKELLKSGKLSVKKIPTAKVNSMFQDHICSGILGVAAEIFSILPISTVYVNAKMKMLDSSTGHMRDTVIVSVMIPKKTLDELNMESIDPSDAMKNFKCNMIFKASEGFTAVDEIHYGSDEVA